jgi:membrane fusion protein (multidrug efflux system)
VALLATLVLGLAVPGCEGAGGKHSWAGEGKQDKVPLAIEVVGLERASIQRFYRTSGLLQALRSAEIVALQTGIIQNIQVEEGDEVDASAILARLDGRELKLQAAANKLQVDNLEAQLTRLKSAQGAISREEIDQQKYAVAEARAAAKLSGHAAKQSMVRAPFAGTITVRHIDEGNLAGATSPLFTLQDLSALQLELHLPERESAGVATGSRVELELVDGSRFKAEIIRRAPVVDPTTGTVKFTVQTDDVPPGAAPGAFVRAFVLVESADSAPALPVSAVFKVNGAPHVFVVADGVASRTAVETGVEGEAHIEIRGGLADGDVVVRNGAGGISEGMALRAVTAEGAKAEAKAAADARAKARAEGKAEGDGKGRSGRGRKHGA